MTNKEAGQMARLRVENARLRDEIDRHMVVYRECLYERVEMQTKIEMIEFALRGKND